MVFVYYCIFGVDVGDWQFYDVKQSGGGWIFFCSGFVSDDVYGVYWEVIVGVVGQFGVDVFLFVWQGGEWYLQLDDVFVRFQYVVNLVWCSGIVEYWFIFFILGNGVGYYCCVVVLVMGDGFVQVIGVNLMVNYCFVVLFWGIVGEICFIVIVGIKQFGDLWIFELIDGGDVVLFSGFFVD